RALHLAALGRHNLVVLDGHWALASRRAQLFATLLHDIGRLPHLFHANQITVEAVAVLSNRNIEIELGIAFVRLRLAKVPGRARAAHHHARETPIPAVGELDDTDVDIALLEDTIAGKKRIEILDDFQKWIAERVDVVYQLRRQILMDATGPKIGRVHARP